MSIVSNQCRNGTKGGTQARVAPGKHFALAATLGASMLGASMLAGCSSGPSINPVDWWHSLEGGPLDGSRPPPPNADAAYPSLGSVPAKPAAPDAGTRNALSSGLVADRANAQYGASLAPIRTFSSAAPARPPAMAPQTGGDDETMGAKMGAATAPMRPLGPPQPPLPPVTVTPPRKAPVTPVAAAPLPPPPVVAPTVAAPATVASADAAPGAPPAMPEAPPAAATIPGVALPITVPTPPPPTPKPAVAPAAAIRPGDPVAIAFQTGSATLPSEATAALKALAQRRGNLPIVVVGYGDATSEQASDQSAALPLALSRARSISAALQSAGVAAADLRIDAQARGEGGAARIAAP